MNCGGVWGVDIYRGGVGMGKVFIQLVRLQAVYSLGRG